MYWTSNRKSGSPSRNIGSPPYFYFFFYKFANRQILGSSSIPLIWDIWSGTIFFEKMGIESFGGVALFRFHPLGAPFPYLTLGYFGPSFCSGGSPPFGGDMNFGRFALWPTFLSYGNFPVAIFLQSESTYSLFSILTI